MITGTESAASAFGIALKDDLESKGEGEKTDGDHRDGPPVPVWLVPVDISSVSDTTENS